MLKWTKASRLKKRDRQWLVLQALKRGGGQLVQIQARIKRMGMSMTIGQVHYALRMLLETDRITWGVQDGELVYGHIAAGNKIQRNLKIRALRRAYWLWWDVGNYAYDLMRYMPAGARPVGLAKVGGA